MQRILIGALALAAISGAPARAASPALMDEFQSICMDTLGAPDAAAAVARAHDLVTPPPIFSKTLKAMPGMTVDHLLWGTYEGGVELVLIGASATTFLPSGISTNMCIVASLPQSDTDLSAALKAKLGVAPAQRQGAIDLFIYEDRNGVAKPVDAGDDAEAKRLMEAGRLRVVMAGTLSVQDYQGSLIGLIVPIRPAQKADAEDRRRRTD